MFRRALLAALFLPGCAMAQPTLQDPPAAAYHLRAWPLIYGTILTTAVAVLVGLVFSLFSAARAPEARA